MQHWQHNNFGYWAVAEYAAPSEIIGFAGVMRKQIAHLYGLNMYFRFTPSAWGKGYATQVARTGLEFAFTQLHASEVFGLVRPANIPSRKTLERAGFVLFTHADDVPGAEPSLIYRAELGGMK